MRLILQRYKCLSIPRSRFGVMPLCRKYISVSVTAFSHLWWIIDVTAIEFVSRAQMVLCVISDDWHTACHKSQRHEWITGIFIWLHHFRWNCRVALGRASYQWRSLASWRAESMAIAYEYSLRHNRNRRAVYCSMPWGTSPIQAVMYYII